MLISTPPPPWVPVNDLIDVGRTISNECEYSSFLKSLHSRERKFQYQVWPALPPDEVGTVFLGARTVGLTRQTGQCDWTAMRLSVCLISMYATVFFSCHFAFIWSTIYKAHIEIHAISESTKVASQPRVAWQHSIQLLPQLHWQLFSFLLGNIRNRTLRSKYQ